MTDNRIITQNLTKKFGDLTAVDNLSITVSAGEVFGLLGPNGAGKTTTIRMLSALIEPSNGTAQVAGFEVGEQDTDIRRHVGILTESPGLYDQLSAERNLAFFAKLYEVEDIEAQVKKYLQLLGLWQRRSEPVAAFSKGMRQKLAIARALLHEPQVLFLDEPTSALDPEAALIVRDFIADLRDEGRAIIICTHNLDEADRLCDRIAIFKARLLALDTPANLRRQLYGRAVVFHLVKAEQRFADLLATKQFVESTQLLENKIVANLDDPEAHNPELIRTLVEAGAEIQFVGELRRTLEDVYLHLVRNTDSNAEKEGEA